MFVVLRFNSSPELHSGAMQGTREQNLPTDSINEATHLKRMRVVAYLDREIEKTSDPMTIDRFNAKRP